VALEEGLERHVEGEVRRLGAREGQGAHERVDPPLAAGDPRPARQLSPVELHDLAGAVAGALGRSLDRRTQLSKAALDDVDRALIAVLAQDVGHPRCLDRRALFEHLDQHRLEGIELGPLRRATVARWLVCLEHPSHGAAVDPEPGGDLTLRDALGLHRS